MLPMFGDYYTNDLISGSPNTNMLGNSVNLLVQGGPQKNLGAAMVLVLMTLLAVGCSITSGRPPPGEESAGVSATATEPQAPRPPAGGSPEPAGRTG